MPGTFSEWIGEKIRDEYRFDFVSMYTFGEIVWEAATKAAEEKFTSTNSVRDKTVHDCGTCPYRSCKNCGMIGCTFRDANKICPNWISRTE